MEHLEEMPVRTLVLVDRHGSGKASAWARRCLPAAAAALAALALPAAALAHATLLSTTPENGAVLGASPPRVTMRFDDTVRVTNGNAVVANATGRSVLGGAPRAHGRLLVLPLRPNLPRGAYSVRWSIVSDDGHHEEGVIAFAVGAGSAPPSAVLGASGGFGGGDVLLRTLYYLGLLAGGGAAVFGLQARRLLGGRPAVPLARLLLVSLLLLAAGGAGALFASPPGTRYAHVLAAATALAVAGAAAAALALEVPRLVAAAGACAIAELAAPALSGHALDPDQPRAVAVAADLGHVAAASLWLGGLAALVFVVPRATADDGERRAAARLVSATALAAVIVLAATGAARALTELTAVSQLWTTSYGRVLIAKTALFAAALCLGWLNRSRLLDSFARLTRSVRFELVALLGVVVAVAILTELRPGVAAPPAAAQTQAAPQPPALPPRDGVVDARELGSLAVAVAREPRRTTVTLLGPDGEGVNGRAVRIDGAATVSCGAGCYRAATPPAGPLRVAVGGRSLTFALPSSAPDAAPELARVTAAYRRSKTIVFDETLASNPANAETTLFQLVAPHTLRYDTEGGPSAVVIGPRRWDRDTPASRWIASPQTPLDVTQPYWRSATNVHEIAPGELTFLDRTIPAWFRLTLVNGRPSLQHMTAAAHFMVDRYRGFDVPVAVSPPASR